MPPVRLIVNPPLARVYLFRHSLFNWLGRWDLNPRPETYKVPTLTPELLPNIWGSPVFKDLSAHPTGQVYMADGRGFEPPGLSSHRISSARRYNRFGTHPNIGGRRGDRTLATSRLNGLANRCSTSMLTPPDLLIPIPLIPPTKRCLFRRKTLSNPFVLFPKFQKMFFRKSPLII